MPKKASRYGLRVPWPEAVQIAGGEERLLFVEGQRRPYGTTGNWQKGGVPSHILAEFLLSWWRGEHKPPAPDPEMEKLMDTVRAIIESDNKLVKDALRTNLEVFRLAVTKRRRR